MGFFPVKVFRIKPSNALCCFLCECTECYFKKFGKYFYKEFILIACFCEHLFLQSLLWKALYCFSFKILQLKTSSERVKKVCLSKCFAVFIETVNTKSQSALSSQSTHTADVYNHRTPGWLR